MKLEEKINNWDTENIKTADSIWESWKNILIEAAKEGIGTRVINYKQKPWSWFDKEVDVAIEERKAACRLHRNDTFSEVQGGFRRTYRCDDHIFTLKNVAACRLNENKHTYMAFLDFREAFDSVWRNGLLKAVWLSGIRGKIWRMGDKLYSEVNGIVRLGDTDTELFEIEQ
ncbi:uncharacterized protein LOC117106094 [Anneissia japonica]|uniref:uncharacterized protein LOC117106094 n=1 Tax=Anneissia japonica TaxID=1529436 RepID=UPI0014255725|nr:uncharacterized protein LOC117106094 [Anneissia japonica]